MSVQEACIYEAILLPGLDRGRRPVPHQYPGGLPGFVARADELAELYGERFRPPSSLRTRADNHTLQGAS